MRETAAKAKSRSTYADPIFDIEDNDNGINSLFLVALTPKYKEDYILVSQVISKLKLEKVTEPRFVNGGDQKYINLLCGVGEHSSTCPCSWCSLPAKSFRKRLKYDVRTWGGLRRLHLDLVAAGPRAEAKFFGSVKNWPLLPYADEKTVLETVMLPQLHFLLQALNHIWKGLAKAWKLAIGGRANPAKDFAISVHAVSTSYHGKAFAGNECRRLLKNLDKLALAVPVDLAPYVTCLSNLNKIVTSCFSVLGPQGTEYLNELDAFYHSAVSLVDLSFTPTLHGITAHVKDFFAIHGTEFGLGLYTEQAGEAVHYDFENTVYNAAFKRPECHPEYGPLLLRAVAGYNATHLRPRAGPAN